FFDTSIYMVDSNKRVFGGKKGEDQNGRNRAAWRFAVAAGHEIADHTVNHFNGGSLVPGERDCCQTGDWSVAHWTAEIASCRTSFTDARFGLGAKDVLGFRAPFLRYNDHLFTALAYAYDSSVPNCFDDAEDGTNCSWPYSLDNGSPDADAFVRKLTPSDASHLISLPALQMHPGLFELPVTTLIVPADTLGSRYHFNSGLRERIAARAPLSYPSLYEASSGKITGRLPLSECHMLHPIRSAMAAARHGPWAARADAKALRHDAPLCFRGSLCELLRCRPAKLARSLLGSQPAAPCRPSRRASILRVCFVTPKVFKTELFSQP
ncbi:MAG: hypothetical protein ACXWKB_00450, partial [Methyloceanibacter sp.]